MLKAKLITIFLFAFAGLSAYGHTAEEGKIYATAGPFLYRTMVTQDVAAKNSPFMTGGALIAEGDVDENGGVEIALFYIDKLYLRESGEDFVTEKIKRMYITTGYRHWFNDVISAGLSVFSSYSMGDRRVVHNELSGNDRYPTTAEEITEYGLDASCQYDIWGNDWLAFTADARYSVSLTHKSHEDANVFGLLLGIKYLIPKDRLGKGADPD